MKARIIFVASETFKTHLLLLAILWCQRVELRLNLRHAGSIQLQSRLTKITQKSHKNSQAPEPINHQSMKARIIFVASETFKNHLLSLISYSKWIVKNLENKQLFNFASIAFIGWSTRAIL